MTDLMTAQGTELEAGGFVVVGGRPLETLTRAEAAAVVAACVAAGAPARIALSFTGQVRLEPADAGDGIFESLLGERLRSTRRRGRGSDAATAVGDRFRTAGWRVRVSDWPPRWVAETAVDEGRLKAAIEEWLDEGLAALVAERPALREWADEYRASRRAQLHSGALRVYLRHTELLAWPR